jgi:tRNA A37 threonylcarbamoyladenosine dehydratase
MHSLSYHLDAFRRLYTTPPDDAASDSNPDAYLTVVERLSRATVIVVGLGGVGSWAAEALCRSGVGNLVLIDLDDICISNTNRQLHALSSTVGKMKIEEMKRRLLDINPQCHVTLIHDFVGPDNVQDILLGVSSVSGVSACLDAIDGARGKTSLIAACASLKIPIVTCGGSAGRTDPTKFVYDDLTRVQNDKLLAACRKDLRKHYGFEAGLSFRELQQTKAPRKWRIQAVYSMETPKIVPQGTHGSSMRRCDGALGTACFVTGTAGFVAAGLIVDMIANDKLKAPNCLRRR